MKKVVFIFMLALGFAWNCHAQGQGWTYVQDSITTGCKTGANSCTIDVPNANLLPTVAGSVWVIIVNTGSNVSISSVTGGGGTWTACPSNGGCHLFDSSVPTDVDAMYNLTGNAGTTSITVNLSGASANFFKLNFIELLPPPGATASLDAVGAVSSITCTTCTGVGFNLSATDAIVQFEGHDPVGWNAWSSPYITDTQGNGIYLNATSGAAPTVALGGLRSIILGLAFKSTAGSFTPPAQPMSVVNYTNPQGVVCSPSCTLTIPATGSGHLLYIEAGNLTSSRIVSVTGGGTWVAPNGPNTCAIVLSGGFSLSCAYALSSTAGTTSLNVTMSGNSNNYFALWEVASSSGPFSLDKQGSATNSPGPTAPGVALTLTGSDDVIFQAIFAPGGSSSVSLYPMPYNKGNGEQFFNAQAGAVVLLNTKNGAAPNWTTTNSATTATGVAFRAGTGTAPAPPTGLAAVVN